MDEDTGTAFDHIAPVIPPVAATSDLLYNVSETNEDKGKKDRRYRNFFMFSGRVRRRVIATGQAEDADVTRLVIANVSEVAEQKYLEYWKKLSNKNETYESLYYAITEAIE